MGSHCHHGAGIPIAWTRGVLTMVLVLVMVLLVAGGCRRNEAAKTARPEVRPVERKVERGPVKMTVRVDRERVSIADKFKLTIEVTAADGVDVTMPKFGDKLSEFEIHDFTEQPGVPTAGGRTWTQTYVLEGFLSGKYEIPGITARFTDRRKGTGESTKPVEGELTSEPIAMEVISLLSGEFDPTKFRDIKGTVELPAEPSRIWRRWVPAGAGALALVGLGLWLLRRRRARAAMPVAISPYEWAFHELLRLEEDRFLERGLVHEFYFRLTDIIRQYIERQFGIMAPEQTTEEFLREVREHPALSTDHKGLLGAFLQAADLVKFARYEPAPAEAERAFGAARDFVNQTCTATARPAEPRVAKAEVAA